MCRHRLFSVCRLPVGPVAHLASHSTSSGSLCSHSASSAFASAPLGQILRSNHLMIQRRLASTVPPGQNPSAADQPKSKPGFDHSSSTSSRGSSSSSAARAPMGRLMKIGLLGGSLVAIAGLSVYGFFYYGWRDYPPGVRDWMRQGMRAMLRKEWPEAEACFLEAINLTENDHDSQDIDGIMLRTAFLRVKLAELYQIQQKYDDAAREYAICFDVFRRAGNLEKALAMVQEMVVPMMELRLFDEAEEILRWAIKTGKDHSLGEGKIGPLFGQLGEVLHTAGKEEEAMVQYKRAIDVAQRTLGKKHCEVALLLNNMAALTPSAKDSQAYAREALEISLARCPQFVGYSHFNLGKSMVGSSPDESKDHLSKARTIATDQQDWGLLEEVKKAEKEFTRPAMAASQRDEEEPEDEDS